MSDRPLVAQAARSRFEGAGEGTRQANRVIREDYAPELELSKGRGVPAK
jgi:hypothetical protein